jgi:hypothetical protein
VVSQGLLLDWSSVDKSRTEVVQFTETFANHALFISRRSQNGRDSARESVCSTGSIVTKQCIDGRDMPQKLFESFREKTLDEVATRAVA